MGRKRNADPLDQARRLTEVKTMIKDSADAMPGMARELRRNATETLDDIIAELATPARIRRAGALAIE
ncbi:hypothetical protein [Sphingomonas melonis]|jgi:hypothetical protein|uniref:hypothetical protein n=1 Tax=Sphingomonas melonis TaxID=152682 RepID=UPI00036E6D59|nr:hypothetical protein [Sphingomonas melonis]